MIEVVIEDIIGATARVGATLVVAQGCNHNCGLPRPWPQQQIKLWLVKITAKLAAVDVAKIIVNDISNIIVYNHEHYRGQGHSQENG